MKTIGKETRRMLCCLLAICLAAAAGFTVLLSYMANDYQKTMVEHDYGTAGYLVNHPDTNVAAAFTKDKTDSDLEAGRRILKEAGYHGSADPRLIPAYTLTESIPPPGSEVCFFFLCFSGCFSDSLDLHPETKQSDSKGRYCDHPFPFRDTDRGLTARKPGTGTACSTGSMSLPLSSLPRQNMKNRRANFCRV